MNSTNSEVSVFRLYLLRATYLLISLFLGTQIWPAILLHAPTGNLMHGVGRCLLGAMLPLMLLGIRDPLHMLPMLLFELIWKAVWLIAIGLPLRSADPLGPEAAEHFKACAVGVVLCLIVIPWPYVWTHFVKRPGDRWK